MKLHEYQAKSLLHDAGVPVPEGRIARTPAEAEKIARDIGCPVMVKAQVLTGGRGKAGGPIIFAPVRYIGVFVPKRGGAHCRTEGRGRSGRTGIL